MVRADTPPHDPASAAGDPERQLHAILFGSADVADADPSGPLSVAKRCFAEEILAACGEAPSPGVSLQHPFPGTDEDDASTEPCASAMLGWTDEHQDPEDAFAARLVAAFLSGALDVRSRGIVQHAVEQRVSDDALRPAETRKRNAPRGPLGQRPDAKAQSYNAVAMNAGPLYMPW